MVLASDRMVDEGAAEEGMAGGGGDAGGDIENTEDTAKGRSH